MFFDITRSPQKKMITNIDVTASKYASRKVFDQEKQLKKERLLVQPFFFL